jgi:phosphopantothenoylcysteine decarboxylase/phosphopantothenate--cysteine ligase
MKGKRIILGVSGGIAAYKAVYLLREFQKAGAEVRVVMTPSATRFVGLETFEALSRSPVPVYVFNEGSGDTADSWSKHIHWAEWADVMVVVPCTANTLAKIVGGFSDNMLTTTAMAIRCPLVLCPTMDGGMFRSAATQRNLKLAEELGYHLIAPESGYLASGLHDEGRMPAPEVIIAKVSELLSKSHQTGADANAGVASALLKGKRVLVTAGPTREYIDAVRFISNPSSGKMGVAMATAAAELGAEVTLIHGKISLDTRSMPFKSIEITSAGDLFKEVHDLYQQFDVVVMSAAVSDFTPLATSDKKIKKTEASREIKLKPTVDILKWLGENRVDGQKLIGFAMETNNLESEVRRKLTEKKVDWIVGNLLNQPESGFEGDNNSVLVVGVNVHFSLSGSKQVVAKQILEKIFN